MRRSWLLLPVILILFSCKHAGTFTVDGVVPDTVFNGSKVYLVALDGPITKRVDSTVLTDGKFHFEMKADTLGVRILRIPFRLPDMVEDLVVVTEAGTMTAELSSDSHGSGTPLNNKLQGWKDKKRAYERMQQAIFNNIKEAGSDSLKADSLKKYSAKLSALFKADNRKMMRENIKNGIGLLLFKVYYHDLSAEERKEILEHTGILYPDHDAQLKLMISNDQDLKNR